MFDVYKIHLLAYFYTWLMSLYYVNNLLQKYKNSVFVIVICKFHFYICVYPVYLCSVRFLWRNVIDTMKKQSERQEE